MPTKLNPGAEAFVDQLRQNVDLARKKGEKQVEGLGTGNYSWANPLAMKVKTNSYTAKNLPFSELGIGLANYGWNEQNIFSKLQDSRKAFRTHQKMGGHQDIYNFMMDQAATFGDKKQGQLFKQYLETGTIPSGLTMDTVMQHADYGLRANARKQQRKKKGFLGGNIGAIIGAIGGAIIGCIAGGPGGCAAGWKAGAAAGGAAGGAGQAINEDRGLLGTALAAYSGYTLGATAGNVATAATTGAQQAAVEGGKQAVIEGTRKAGESALIEAAKQQGLSWAINPVTGAVINVAEQGVRSLAGSLTAPFQAVAAPMKTLDTLWNAATNPLQTFQGTGFYQGAVEPWVKAGQGLSGGIGSLGQPQTWGAGFTSGSGGYFAPAYSGGPAAFTMPYQSPGSINPVTKQPIQKEFFESQQPLISSSQAPVFSDPVMAGPNRYNIYYPEEYLPGQRVLHPNQYTASYNKGLQANLATTPSSGTKIFPSGGDEVTGVLDSTLGALEEYPQYINVPDPMAPALSEGIGSTVDPSQYLGGPTGASIPVSATTGIGSLPTHLYAKGSLKQILDPVTPEEYAEDKGFFTEGNISRDMLNLEGEGIYGGKDEGEPQLTTYDSTSLGQPGPYTRSSGYAGGPRRQLPDYERGALGRRVYAGDPVTLQNQFDLAPYFRTPVFNKGGGVGSCASGSCACPSCYEAGGAVDAGQDKGFPFMGQIPDNMQSKFKAYESGTQSYADSSGEQLEEGYRRVSGSGMEPVEERYIETPAGIQEFFSRSPSGYYRLQT